MGWFNHQPDQFIPNIWTLWFDARDGSLGLPRKERKQINRNRTMILEMCLYGDICIFFRIYYIWCTRVCVYIYVYVNGFMHRLVASLHSVWLWLAGPVATCLYIYIYSLTVLFVRYPTFSCSVADIRLHLSNWTGRLRTSGVNPEPRRHSSWNDHSFYPHKDLWSATLDGQGAESSNKTKVVFVQQIVWRQYIRIRSIRCYFFL